MATNNNNNNTRIINNQVRGINNVVFYVGELQRKKGEKWQNDGWVVNIKHYNQKNPFAFDHFPSNKELSELWSWRR